MKFEESLACFAQAVVAASRCVGCCMQPQPRVQRGAVFTIVNLRKTLSLGTVRWLIWANT